ncbi:hypothetical protein DFP73DRAFT_595147 [Morchella snyderi]|nr:hypothetical protein DFP73DRAFT_595147 [Morchella snyderi]
MEENSVVLYRPAIGPKKGLVWRAMSGAAEYGRMMGVCAEGGVVVKLADAAWWDPEAPEQEELPVNPQIWRDQVLAGKNKKIRTIAGVFEISKGQKKAAQQKSAKASTQVSSPHPDSQVIGYSNTQPIPGRSSAGHKRKANSPKTVSDKRGLELPGHGENVAETQIAASQLPESQFPESQLPEWQIPETQIIASQFPESQYPDSIPDSQAPQIEKKKRGRPKGSGKKKGVPPPTIGEEDTINPGTSTEGPRPKRTIKRTGKAAETAAIQAEKNAIEQMRST